MFYNTWKCGKLLYSLYCLFYEESDKNIQSVKKIAYECGPIGQKLLQFIAMHDGFLTPSCKKHFTYVFENCEIHNWKETEKMYLDAFQRKIEEDYVITPKGKIPIGSGSIGQVYKLYHKERGEFVAMKVRHPNIEKEAKSFISTVTWLLTVIEMFKNIPFSILIKEFLNNVYLQLDYCIEAENTQQMYENFKTEHHIIIPKVYEYNDRCIVMSYHKGESFIELTDMDFKRKVSCDIYLYTISCILNHDFIHCDLHYGNWKIVQDPEYKLIIYDCGIIGKINNHQISKDIVLNMFNGDYLNLLDVLIPNIDAQKYGKDLRNYIEERMKINYEKSSDRFADILKYTFSLGISVDLNVLRCIQGLLITTNIMVISTDKLTSLLEKQGGNCKEVIICYNHGLLSRLGRYTDLLHQMKEWIEKDPTIESVFYNWLDDSFGHRDKEVFMDVVLHNFKF